MQATNSSSRWMVILACALVGSVLAAGESSAMQVQVFQPGQEEALISPLSGAPLCAWAGRVSTERSLLPACQRTHTKSA